MSSSQPTSNRPHKLLTGRRLTLLASVAGLGIAVLVAGPGGYVPARLPAWTSSATAADATSQHPASFADLVAKVKPAVISVRVKINDETAKSASMRGNEEEQIPIVPGSPMEKFFQQFGSQNMPNGVPQQHRHDVMVGEGSGFFISADGYAVTNNHVVDHAKSVQVTTDDGTIYKAKVIGTDPKTDLALIKVDGKNDFPFVNFADAHAARRRLGCGGRQSVRPRRNGHRRHRLGRAARDIGSGPYDDYVQIDAPINKGNSGGPAFNVDGNVIGVNTAIFSPSGGSVGIGFDIPAATAKMVVAQLKEHGHRHPRLARRANSTRHRRHRRKPRHEKGRRRNGRRAAGRQSRRQSRNRDRRRDHRGQRHTDQGRARAGPHHRHDGARQLGQARHPAQGRKPRR